MLWEAVRTSWFASPDPERSSVAQQLVDHANHVLRNSFREELRIPAGPSTRTDWEATTAAVTVASLTVDGRDRPAVQIDTDPLVYAVGFRVDEHVVCTCALPRDSLPFLDLEVAAFE